MSFIVAMDAMYGSYQNAYLKTYWESARHLSTTEIINEIEINNYVKINYSNSAVVSLEFESENEYGMFLLKWCNT